MPQFDAVLAQALEEAGVAYEEEQIKSATMFKELLFDANRSTNLTAITDEEDAAIKHFADSLLLLRYATFPEGARLVDIGTGPGFPGIPLKLFCPDLEILLLESVGKKCGFLSSVIESMSLEGIDVYCGRAEELAREPLQREHFDFATARAVAELRVLLEYALPLLAVGGKFFAFKGPEAENEVEAAQNAIALLGGEVEGIETYQLPSSTMRRSLITVKKVAPTDEKYPRRAGMPAKRP